LSTWAWALLKRSDRGVVRAAERSRGVTREGDAGEGTLSWVGDATRRVGGGHVATEVRSTGWAEGVLSSVVNGDIRSLSQLNSEGISSGPSDGEVDFVETTGDGVHGWENAVGSDGVEIATSGNNGELSLWLGDIDQVVELISALEVEVVWFTDKDNSAELFEAWSHWVQVGAESRSDLDVAWEVVELASAIHVGSVNLNVVNEELELVPGSFLSDIDSNSVRTVSVVEDTDAVVVLSDAAITESEASRNDTIVVGNNVIVLIVELDLEAECASSDDCDWGLAIWWVIVASWDQGHGVLDGDLTSSHDGFSGSDGSLTVDADCQLVNTSLLERASWEGNGVVQTAGFGSVWVGSHGANIGSCGDLSTHVEEFA
jgi:hypothetical protein